MDLEEAIIMPNSERQPIRWNPRISEIRCCRFFPSPRPQLFTPKAALPKPSSYFKSILYFCFLSNEDTFDFGEKKITAPIKVKIT